MSKKENPDRRRQVSSGRSELERQCTQCPRAPAPHDPTSPGKPRFWTPDKVERLREEWAVGTNIRLIADMLGGSRNTIIGKAHRLQLPMHSGSLFHPDAPRKPRKQKQEKRMRIRRPRAAMPQSAPLPPPPQPDTAPPPLRISFADLQWRHCRYSVSSAAPHFFCGHPRQGKSAFCPFHHALCHEKPREKPRREKRGRFNFGLMRARAA
jgi:GcrA cell cycle regulator